MFILDSNIIIYADIPDYSFLKSYTNNLNNSISLVTTLEVLGFNKITELQKSYFNDIFRILSIYPIDTIVINKAIQLRQQRKMSLGDSIIAATALENKLTLVTRNTEDFSWIENIKLHNPFTENDQH